jgi:hypothetical protein
MALTRIKSAGVTSGGITANQLNIGQIGGRRNVIINGGFTVSQRNAAALTATTNNTYFLDRWRLYLNGSCAVSTQQMLSLDTNVTALNTASGETFNNVLSIDCTTAASLGSTDLLGIIQMIEGYNTVPLAGQVCTLSFHVKTNVTGQYYVALKMSGSSERTYLAPYTVSSANTWEKKTITFTMDTATNLNNTASVTTGSGLQVYFGMRLGTSGQMSNTLNAWHAGNYYGKSDQVTWGTNTSDTFYLGGIQLEKGSLATPFEHRSFGEELSLCQRYYQAIPKYTFFNGAVEVSSNSLRAGVPITRPLRASPTIGNITLIVYDDDDTSFSNAAHAVFANSEVPAIDGTTGFLSIVFNGNLSGRTDNHNVTALYGTKGTLDAEL